MPFAASPRAAMIWIAFGVASRDLGPQNGANRRNHPYQVDRVNLAVPLEQLHAAIVQWASTGN
jgi:hypothetical protein